LDFTKLTRQPLRALSNGPTDGHLLECGGEPPLCHKTQLH